MKYLILLATLFLNVTYVFSQNITVKLIDKANKAAIPYANIKTGKHSGVISNEEGYFTVNITGNNTQTITISCLGYQNKTLSIETVKSLNFVIELDEAVNELSEVFISNRKPNVDSIIAKVKTNMTLNYKYKLNKHNIFHRDTYKTDFKKLNFEIEKASHVKSKSLNEANANLSTLSKKVKNSDIINFTDFKGELYCLDKDSTKLVVNKATKLVDSNNDFSIDDIQKRTQNIILKYIDTTKTYKLKSGLFKIEDSLSLNDEKFKENQNNEFKLPHLNRHTNSLLRKSQFYDKSFLNKILNTKLYTYTLENVIYNEEVSNYIINFIPKKGKAKYTGLLIVSDDTYAITRVNFSYYQDRHGQKVNLKFLLGIKYIENASEGTLLFEKNSTNMYYPKYLKHTTESYFYLSRDLKFIENSKAKKKVNCSFKFEGTSRYKEELLFTANNNISLEDFNAIKQSEIAPYKILNSFENTIWKNEEIIEPLDEMKRFGE